MMAQSKPKQKGTNYVVNKAYIFIICPSYNVALPPTTFCPPPHNILSMTFFSNELFTIFIESKSL